MKVSFLLIMFSICNLPVGDLVASQKQRSYGDVLTSWTPKDEKANCNTLITKLIKTSSYSTEFGKDYKVIIDEITDTVLTLKITYPKYNTTAPISWLIVNLKSFTVYDVTFDPENPIELKSNKELISQWKTKCG